MPSIAECVRRVGILSKNELDSEAVRLTGVLRLKTAQLIAHLAEIGDRGLALELGYPSLFEYCVKRLGMSEAQTWLRLQVAKACRGCPAVLEALAANRMSLTVAGRIAPHLTRENACEVLADCAGMTRREVDEYVVRFRPKRDVGSGRRKVPSGPEPTMFTADDPTVGDSQKTASQTQEAPRSRVEPVRPDRYTFYFSTGTSLKEKIERLGQVLGVVDSQNRLEEILEVAIDLALEKKDPRKKQERRMQREAKKAQSVESDMVESEAADEPAVESESADASCPDETTDSGITQPPVASRHISAATRDRVLAKADYQCEFVGPDGTRCSRQTGLEVDHILPFAKEGHGPEGPHAESNLRCLCGPHNRWCAEQKYGRDFIRDKIEARQQSA